MDILLINTNPVISKLFSWNTRSVETIVVDEISRVDEIPQRHYDLLFIDDMCCEKIELDREIFKIDADEKILFSADKESKVEGIDRVILKPFLPTEITTVLQSFMKGEDIGIIETNGALISEEILNLDEDLAEQNPTILDEDEIEIIKQLLLDEGLEVDQSEEEDILIENNHTPKSATTKRSGKKKKRSKDKFEEKLLEYLLESKPKKIKRLLEGAEVTVTIKFPKES